VTRIGAHIKERLEKEFLPLPNVGNITGDGLHLLIEIVAEKETRRRFSPEANVIDVIMNKCRENGLFARGQRVYGADLVFFMPPLIITKEEADKELDILYPIIAGLKDL